MSSLHERAKDLFLSVLAQPEASRLDFLAEACQDDHALRQEVESLLQFHDEEEAEPRADVGTAERMFAPGEMFAGRYRMVARIGRGGMGAVWRAEDVMLQTEVALKVIFSTTADGRERILSEVRLARQITHPAVCRVFDIGDVDGVVFYSMEFVRGEDLATLVRRVGRLPSEKVADIGRQLCAGLSAAHAQRVLHRDLKPANVLIDDEGLVRITDFGIAVLRTDAGQHTFAGTPAYMAPEQRTPGGQLSERTDIYALGLVLYELLVGHHTVQRDGDTAALPRPSIVVPNVDPQLERVVMRALSHDSTVRPASAHEMAAGLPDIGLRRDGTYARDDAVPRGLWTQAWAIGAAVLAIVGILAVGYSYFVSPGARTLTERDTVVLADFENTTGEAVFDGALKVALAVALEQSPFLKVFPDDRARETLRLMERPQDERVTRALARDVARREQLKALIAGSIASLGSNYVLTLEAVNAETGDVMAREQVEATSKEQVLSSLGSATAKLRNRLGESLASVEKYDVPLPKATTASFEALQAYSLALDRGRVVANPEAVPYLKRAIELDPDFALALATLSGIYANTGQSGQAPEYATRAFALRDRVSERERFFISWRYYRDVTHDTTKALELTQSWMAAYPREMFAFNSSGLALVVLGRNQEAIAPYREAIRLDPKYYAPYSNLGEVLLNLNRFDEVDALVKQAADQQVDFFGIRRMSYLLAFLKQDQAGMTRHINAVLATPLALGTANWQPRVQAYEGRMQLAAEGFRTGARDIARAGLTQLSSQFTMEGLEFRGALGQCTGMSGDVSSGLASSPDELTLARASRALAICGAGDEAMKLLAELARQFPASMQTRHLLSPMTAAAVALSRREPDRALELLEAVRPYDHALSAESWPPYLRGHAHLMRKDAAAAGVEFQSVLDHRGQAIDSPIYPLAFLGRARAAAMAGDMATARTSYQSAIEIWRNADKGLQPLAEAVQESARLR